MVKEIKSYLCIGGPYDGRRYASKDDLGFRVPKLVRQPMAFSPFNATIAPATIEHVFYVADRVRCGSPEKEVWFWRPSEQSLEGTMKMLLERYEQANNIIWTESPFPL
jgi:hypothetical protein